MANTKFYGGGPAYLGAAYRAFMPNSKMITSSGANRYDPVPLFGAKDGQLSARDTALASLRKRNSLLSEFDVFRRELDRTGSMDALDKFRRRALAMLTSSRTARAFDLIYLRPTPVGRATALHYDYPFFAGSAQPMINAWIPIGDIPVEDGPLVIVEHSNRFSDLIDQLLAVDYTSDRSNDVVQQAAYGGASDTDPLRLVTDRDTRLLTADFRSGDVLLINMFTLHGSLDNVSPLNRVRLSCDVRFQPADQPADDERYFGEYPKGSKGGGYGDMRGAKPLA